MIRRKTFRRKYRKVSNRVICGIGSVNDVSPQEIHSEASRSIGVEVFKTCTTVAEPLFCGSRVEEQILGAAARVAQEIVGMESDKRSGSQEVRAARREVDGVRWISERTCTLDDATRAEEFSGTSTGVSLDADEWNREPFVT